MTDRFSPLDSDSLDTLLRVLRDSLTDGKSACGLFSHPGRNVAVLFLRADPPHAELIGKTLHGAVVQLLSAFGVDTKATVVHRHDVRPDEPLSGSN